MPRHAGTLVAAAASIAASLVLVAGCGAGAAANYPDSGAVVAAQGKWCEALAKAIGGGSGWDQLATCKGAYPTSSAAYLRGMTKCFPARKDQPKAPDNTLIINECNDEVLVAIPTEKALTSEIIRARCARMDRCEKIPVRECGKAFDHLEGAQQAQLTTAYNEGAQHVIAECLGSASCSSDEDAARAGCYKSVGDKLLWFP